MKFDGLLSFLTEKKGSTLSFSLFFPKKFPPVPNNNELKLSNSFLKYFLLKKLFLFWVWGFLLIKEEDFLTVEIELIVKGLNKSI